MDAKQSRPLHFDDVNERVAVIVGGSVNVYAELMMTQSLLGQTKRAYYVINSMIPEWPVADIAVTLHPDKLADWLAKRAAAKLKDISVIYSHTKKVSPLVTHETQDWLGSSGLFATKIAAKLVGHPAVILCGVPMDESLHVTRRKAWTECQTFRAGWLRNRASIAANVRSWDGWTAQLLGEPTPEWLAACLKSAD